MNFLDHTSEERKYFIRGEDVITRPAETLKGVCHHFGLQWSDEVLEPMLHPERSPFACYGPPNAPLGNDPLFTANPVLKPSKMEPATLAGLPDEVARLATSFGY